MSKRLIVALLIVVTLLALANALEAATPPARWVDLLRPASSQVVLPPEWDGVWESTDSTYDCNDVLQSVETNSDTLCAGQDLTYNPATYNVTCTGSANATTADIHCSGTAEVIPECTATLQIDSHVVLSGDSYFSITTTSVSYSGAALGCDLIPPSCTKIRSHATRLSPAPPAYCLTPSRSSTWGEMKIRYR
jgi:hypothetical protein